MGEKKITTIKVSETVKAGLDEIKLVGRFRSFDQMFASLLPEMKIGVLRYYAGIADALGRGRFDILFEAEDFTNQSATED